MPKVPVLLILFNRPWQVRRLIDNLRAVQPKEIFVFVDGPRPTHADDQELCRQTISELERIDWPCDVHRNLSDINLGCKQGPTRAISWFLEQVGGGIILEDDIRIDPSFHDFATELLQRYRDDQRISCVCGYQFLDLGPDTPSYFYSRFPLTWGWATWRDRWFDGQRVLNNFTRELAVADLSWMPSDHDRNDIKRKLVLAHKENHIWDFLWLFSMWSTGRYAILPRIRMAANEGVENAATHTKVQPSYLHSTYTALTPPFCGPPDLAPMKQYDDAIFRELLHTPSWSERLKGFLKNPQKAKKLISMIRVRI